MRFNKSLRIIIIILKLLGFVYVCYFHIIANDFAAKRYVKFDAFHSLRRETRAQKQRDENLLM